MSLFDILGLQPDDYTSVGDYLRLHYIENPDERARMSHARELDEFYEGRGDAEMKLIIEKIYNDQANRQRRWDFIDASLDKYDNIIARIVREKATVYSEPPRRSIAKNDEVYQRFIDEVQLDDAMRELDRKLALHEDALVWYRVRVTPAGIREPVLDIVSPASFWAINHPKDRTLLIGVIFDQRMPGAKDADATYRVWTDDLTFVMNAKCEVFGNSVEQWPLGSMPGVLATTRKPGSKCSLLAKYPSADLLSAQKAIRLQATNLAKESVSATKQAYLSGDISRATLGQRSDTESEVALPEGVSVTALDRGMDLAEFRDNGGYIGDAVAANHGLAPSVLRQRDASSGAEIELRRIPIRELRKERIPVMRRVERKLASVMSMVNGMMRVSVDATGEPTSYIAGDLPEYSFSAEGWSIDFGEVQQPMSEVERDMVYENRRRLQLTDPYEEEMRRNPDLKTIEDAERVVDERIARNTKFVVSQKDYMAASGSLGAAAPVLKLLDSPGAAQKAVDPNSPQTSGSQPPGVTGYG